MAAEAIQGCSTRPTGMNTPAENSVAVGYTQPSAPPSLQPPLPAAMGIPRKL